MNKPVIGFVGMTHLGLVSATGTCSKGVQTICYDENEALIESIQGGKLPVVEPDLDNTVQANGERQCFTARLDDLSACDVVYIAQDVPTDDKGRSDLTNIGALIKEVIPCLKDSAVLVILCQVPPGFTRQISMPHERLYYQVETLVFGRALERATQPERYIVGCDDPDQSLPDSYRTLLEAFSCPILPMRYESAELAKISINMCLVASISVANTLAELCEKIGAVWEEIVPALKLDRRIGGYSYLTPGLGIAGGNLERDLATVIRFAEEKDTNADVVRAFVNNSLYRKEWAARIFHEAVLPEIEDPLIAVWGLAYKENTHSVKNSPSLATIKHLQDMRLRIHDPVVPVEKSGHPQAGAAETALNAVQDADVLMILTPWPEYREIDLAQVAGKMRGKFIIDPYKVIDRRDADKNGMNYFTLGMPPQYAGELN